MKHAPHHRSLAVLGLLAVLAVGCGGGNGSSAGDPAAPVDGSDPGGERPVQFTGAGQARLFGTLTVPETAGGGGVPGVLIVPPADAGSTPLAETGVDDPLARDLAGAFAEAGLATYRYDRRGTGESRIEPDVRLSLEDLVADARGALDLLAERKETAGRDISVVGYDEGGLVALRLAASDDRVKRLVLVSTPGGSLADVRAAELQPKYGPESAGALRSLVAGLLATRSLPPLEEMRTEHRQLFPPEEAAFLADLYGLDPAAEAARVRVPTMIVVPADAEPYDPQRLAAALPDAEVVTSAGRGGGLVLSAELPEDLSDPLNTRHDHGAAPPLPEARRDPAALDRMAQFLTGGSPPARPGP